MSSIHIIYLTLKNNNLCLAFWFLYKTRFYSSWLNETERIKAKYLWIVRYRFLLKSITEYLCNVIAMALNAIIIEIKWQNC